MSEQDSKVLKQAAEIVDRETTEERVLGCLVQSLEDNQLVCRLLELART